MKKLTLLSTFIFIAMAAQAQFAVGIKAGPNFSNLTENSFNSRTGFHFGAFVGLPLGDKLVLQPEVLFSTQGAKKEDVKVALNYVTIPVLLRYKFSILNVHFGPQFGFMTKAEDGGENIEEEIKNSDLSGVVGIGVKLILGFEAGARYTFGFSDITEDDANLPEFQQAKSRVLQIYLAWRLFGG